MSSQNENEIIFAEILPEISRKYESSMFEKSLVIFLKNLRFGNDLEQYFVQISKMKCSVEFDICVAIHQIKINENEEMMFGIFLEKEKEKEEIENDHIETSNSKIIRELQAQIILPNTKEHKSIELRDYDISHQNPFLLEKILELFRIPKELIKIRQNPDSTENIYLHINLQKETQTNRSTIFEAIQILFEFITCSSKPIKSISSIFLPFVHFGKIRISMEKKCGENRANVKLFSFYGSLFGEIRGISSEDGEMGFEKIGYFLSENDILETIGKSEEVEDLSNSSEINQNKSESSEIEDFRNSSESEEIAENSKSLELLVQNCKAEDLTNSSEFKETAEISKIEDSRNILAQSSKHGDEENSENSKIENTSNSTKDLSNSSFSSKIASIISDKMKLPGKNLNFHEDIKYFGIDSIRILELEYHILNEFPNCANSDSGFLIGCKTLQDVQSRIILDQGETSDSNKAAQNNPVPNLNPDPFKIPLSSQQKRILFIKMTEDSKQFDETIRVEFKNKKEAEIRINWIIMRHSILRTNYFEDFQFILSATECFIKILEKSPNILGCNLEIYSENRDIILIFDHISIDGKSLAIFRNEFFSDEQLFSSKPRQYYEYCTRNIDFSAAEKYWKTQKFQAAELPKDSSGFTIKKMIPKRIQTKISEFPGSRFEAMTHFISQILPENSKLGFVVDLRTFEFNETMGCFSNLLPINNNNSETSSIQEKIRNARRYSIYPYEKIVKLSGENGEIIEVLIVDDEFGAENNKKRVHFCEEEKKQQKIIAKYPMTWYIRKKSIEVEYISSLYSSDVINQYIKDVFSKINARENSKKFSKLIGKKSDFPKHQFFTKIQNLKINGSFSLEINKLSIINQYLEKYCSFSIENAVIIGGSRLEILHGVFASWNSGLFAVPFHQGNTSKTIEKIKNKIGNFIDFDIDSPKNNLQANKCRFFNRLSSYDISYVTCTSGSTGEPKLVATAFEGHANLGRNYTETYFLNENSVICQTVDPSFDIFFADITKTLINNSSLILCEDSIPNPQEIEKCRNAYIMPAFLSKNRDFECFRNLETLQFGGESLQKNVLQKILDKFPLLRIWQEYGLTEQTVYSTRKRMKNTTDSRNIGKPYDNIICAIDSRNSKLILEGCGLMRGYFGCGEILRRLETGDIVKLNIDGEIEFVGRNDSQIKINGFRIDLFEIEEIVMSSQLVNSCSCIIFKKKEIALFFIGNCSIEKLEDFLKNNLVSYKIPNRVIKLQEFPLTRTGKIDKLKLCTIIDQETHKSTPNPTENPSEIQELIRKWLEYYSESKITSPDSDIFKDGIDSISIMLTIQKLKSLGIILNPKKFFELRTLRKISQEAYEVVEKTSEVQKLEPNSSYDIKLNHIQERILFECRMAENPDIYRLNFNIQTLQRNSSELRNRINSIVCGNHLIRSKLSRKRGKWIFEVLSATEVFYTSFQTSLVSPKFYETWIRVKSENTIEISIHHIICDARSLQILKNQLMNGDKQFENNFELENSRLEYLEVSNHRIFSLLSSRKSSIKSFELGVTYSTPEVFQLYANSLRKIFKIREDFAISMTFANRSTENWGTVSMFANTLPISIKQNDDLQTISERIIEINQKYSNVEYRTKTDFAINFHDEILPDEVSNSFNQFPILLTISNSKHLARLEYNSELISESQINLLIDSLTYQTNKNQIIQFFKEILQSEEISENDNFFDKGGHSLTAMRLVDLINEQKSIDIPIRLLFENPTPRLLENAIQNYGRSETSQIPTEDQLTPTTLPMHFNLSDQQLQMFYLSQITQFSTEYQLPFIQGFPSNIEVKSIHRALLNTIQQQNIYRTIFEIDEKTGEPIQKIISLTECFIPMTILKFENDTELFDGIRSLCNEIIDVLDGRPLIRAVFLQSSGRNVAFLHLHHLISDARSTQITNQTMNQFMKLRNSPEPLKYNYSDYCTEIRKPVDIDEKYMNSLLQAKPFNETRQEKIEVVKLSIEIDEDLVNQHRKYNLTPFNLFLQKCSTAISKEKGINIAFPILNRNEKTMNICGYFLNNLVINTDSEFSVSQIIDMNYPYLNVIQKFRTKSKNEIASVYLNCRYDLEYDESDDEQLLDLIPTKLHFPIEFDVDLVKNKYKLTMRSNRYTFEEVSRILNEIRGSIVGDNKDRKKKIKNGIIFGKRKDIPSHPWPNLLQKLFQSKSQLTDSFSYSQAYSFISTQALEIQNQNFRKKVSTIRSDDIIGIIGTKSIETTLTCLAVQIAGGAYLPIDQSYPENRISQIIKDTSMVFEVIGKNYRSSGRIFNISNNHCLSYIITTSGTTGKPKSVCISGKSVVNLSVSSTLEMLVRSNSGIYQFTNFVYDNSVLEVVMTISSQARLIYSKDFDPSEFSKMIRSQNITHCLLFPSLVQSFDIQKLRELSYWIVGGEKLSEKIMKNALKLGCCVIQNYGPTETTAFALSKKMKMDDISTNIGLPAVNTRIKLDENGILLIDGIGKMRGYLKMEKREKDKDWYNSGDLCRIQENNQVIFEGRKDSQIKIRGFRVELGEIEKCIEDLAKIKKVKTIFDEESQNIHAFYTGNIEAEEIRNHCLKNLEKHKVPSKYLRIKEFPLTENSKIDLEKVEKYE
ncbi:unnamed protein product [Caenorhabditis angaria]|uniref:Carrier domain-containing protein n=1 Tax=Caenorhabditis angaria TaxID=860376 RepID=A0A9P1IFY9_9PELO|nr:unnamed protein product [Caenorhabditis angaria]